MEAVRILVETFLRVCAIILSDFRLEVAANLNSRGAFLSRNLKRAFPR